MFERRWRYRVGIIFNWCDFHFCSEKTFTRLIFYGGWVIWCDRDLLLLLSIHQENIILVIGIYCIVQVSLYGKKKWERESKKITNTSTSGLAKPKSTDMIPVTFHLNTIFDKQQINCRTAYTQTVLHGINHHRIRLRANQKKWIDWEKREQRDIGAAGKISVRNRNYYYCQHLQLWHSIDIVFSEWISQTILIGCLAEGSSKYSFFASRNAQSSY